MTQVYITFKTEGEAFDYGFGPYEVSRILRVIARNCIDGGATKGSIQDMNGNTIGSYRITLPEEV